MEMLFSLPIFLNSPLGFLVRQLQDGAGWMLIAPNTSIAVITAICEVFLEGGYSPPQFLQFLESDISEILVDPLY